MSFQISPPPDRPPQRLVLLVDDCQESRELYAEYLADEFAIAEASSGPDAVEKALALRPHLVVMDLALPGMGGLEASHRLKRDARTRHIPVVVVSGHEEPRTPGVPPIWDAFLMKPCRPAVLATEIRRALDRAGAAQT